MVNNVLPNQIAGRYLPIFETTNPERIETPEDPRMKGSDLNMGGKQPKSPRARNVGT